MENKNFDDLIRARLEGLGQDFLPQDWDAFEDKLNISEQAGPDATDELFREKLTGLSVDIAPNAWSIFQEKLVLEEIFSEEPQDAFDLAIKDKLDGIVVPAVDNHWAAFEEKLELEESISSETIEDLYIDSVVADQLGNLNVPYNEEHWNQLEQRLDEDDTILAVLFRYKIAEAALILLLLFTFNQFYPLNQIKSIVKDNKTKTKVEIAKEDVASIPTQDQKSESFVDSSDKTSTSNNNKKSSSKSTASIVKNHSRDFDGENIALGQEVIETAKADESVANLLADQSNINNSNNSFSSQTVVLSSDEEKNPDLVASVEESPTDDGLIAEDRSEILIPFAEGVTPEELAYDSEESLPACEACLLQKVAKPYLRVGMFSSFDVNYVMVPYDRLFNIEADNRFSLGYGNGISVALRFGKWELETGGIYSTKKYDPPKVLEVTGSLSEGLFTDQLKTVQLNLVNIPVNLKYAFKNTEKWSIYGLTGSNLNLIMTTNYDREQNFIGGENKFPYAARKTFTESNLTASKKYEDGLLEGGNFLENRYFSVNFGIGFEKHLSSRWSLFTQSTYHHHLFSDGLGPNNDRINNLSIFGGAKVSFR